jgi:hypothetical protein
MQKYLTSHLYCLIVGMNGRSRSDMGEDRADGDK